MSKIINCEVLCGETNEDILNRILKVAKIKNYSFSKSIRGKKYIYIKDMKIKKINKLHQIPNFIHCRRIF